MESASVSARGGRQLFGRSPWTRLPDQILKWTLTVLAGGILVLIGFFFVRLYIEAHPAFARFGVFGFTFDNNWDVAKNIYGALPLVVGTIVTSAVALLIGVPVAIAAALYVTELCPHRLKGPLTILLDLLAAVPSVVYGLWGVFVLVPKLKPIEQWFTDTFSFIPFIGGAQVAGPNYFIGGLILAIMILPIVSAISREVMSTVPSDHKEAALALGATRWEMVQRVVIPFARSGIFGSIFLALARALGETMAVTMVIGNRPEIAASLFAPAYTMPAVLANEFAEATSDLYLSALMEIGLVLLVITIIVNGIARLMIASVGARGEGSS